MLQLPDRGRIPTYLRHTDTTAFVVVTAARPPGLARIATHTCRRPAMSFMDIVSKFNQQADSHSRSQSLNPFSDHFEQSRSPSPRFSREEYGKPVAGSKTDLRGRRAKSHICREILELCTIIHDVGTYNAKKKRDEDDEDDGTIIISFGELFQIYTKISDKVVGLLIAAKRRGFVYFDREILFQRQDDDVLIALLKPISEIGKILKEDIEQASAPVEQTPVEKKEPSAGETRRPSGPHGETSTTGVDGGTPETNGFNNSYCNGEVDGGGGGGGENSVLKRNVVGISESGEVDDGPKSPGRVGGTESSDGTAVDDTTRPGEVDETAAAEHVESEEFGETDAGRVGGADVGEADGTAVAEDVFAPEGTDETEKFDETGDDGSGTRVPVDVSATSAAEVGESAAVNESETFRDGDER